MGDVRRVMMNPLNYLHLEGEGEALSAMILFREGHHEEIFELMLESGMIDDWGPFFEAEKEAKQSLNSLDEGCITDPVWPMYVVKGRKTRPHKGESSRGDQRFASPELASRLEAPPSFASAELAARLGTPPSTAPAPEPAAASLKTLYIVSLKTLLTLHSVI